MKITKKLHGYEVLYDWTHDLSLFVWGNFLFVLEWLGFLKLKIKILKISLIVGLLFGSNDSIEFTKLLSSFEYWFGIGVNEPFTILRAKNCNEVAVKGWVSAQSS